MVSNTIDALKDYADYSVKFAQQIGADWAEARLENVSGTGFGLDNGVPTFSAFDDVSGLSVRFLINGSQGFISTSKFDRANISNLITKAIESVRYSSSTVKNAIGLSEEKVYRKKYAIRPKKDASKVSEKDKIGLMIDLYKHISSFKIPPSSTSFALQDSSSEKYYVNSEGARIQSKIPYIEFFYFYTIGSKSRSSQRWNSIGATGGWESVKKWNLYENLGKEVKAISNNVSKAVKVQCGRTNLVVASEVTGIMVHESVGHPYEADRILGRESAQAGGSFLKPNMIGHDTNSKLISIADDPRLKGSPGFYLYDDEGVKSRKRILIKNGKINELYHNRETAYVFRTKSNGSSRANAYSSEPIVRMANTYVVPRRHNLKELFEEARNGIYIKNFTEWNISDTRTNFKEVGNESYLIKNGKLENPVWRPSVEVTKDKLWSSVVAVGNKRTFGFTTGSCGKGEPMQGIPVYFGGPALLIKGVRI